MPSVLRSVAAPAVVTLAAFLAACSQSPPSTGPSTSGPVAPSEGVQVGNLATDFDLKDGDGRTVHLADYRGKVVLFEFSAMW
ncbi:MAG: hypothetical protein NVS3B10_28580 [Polyangiales bacterium]